MTTRLIPGSTELQAWAVSVELDATSIGFDVRFNRRDGKPRLSLRKGGEVQVAGVPANCEQDLLDLHQYNQNLPQGVLRVADTNQMFTEPTTENYGQTVLLVYDEP